ncbi:hypothetical protein AB0C29_20970 [Actinoplanes sp. NPDC048791]|uniref:hypothetical protein n=1 Tax=Actinoplanes sp. NPDC048791 TaxID=3154623 RepID=UPI0033F415B4
MEQQDRMSAAAELWKTHCHTGFPGWLRSTDVAGVEMALLDADVAGCISSWLNNDGLLSDRRWAVLAGGERQLVHVLPELSGDEAAYCQRLLDMTELAMNSPHP